MIPVSKLSWYSERNCYSENNETIINSDSNSYWKRSANEEGCIIFKTDRTVYNTVCFVSNLVCVTFILFYISMQNI